MNLAASLVLVLAVACGSKKEAPPAETEPTPKPAIKADSTGGTTSHVRVGGSPDDKAVVLALQIQAVHDKEKPLDKAPWHAPGGDWTYLDLTTPGGAHFTVGEKLTRTLQSDVPIHMYDFVVYAADRTEGAKVVDELAAMLKAKVPAKGVEKPLTPLVLVASALGDLAARNPDGSFGGKGTWVAAKWTSERAGHAAEMYFNWSIDEKRAEVTEKYGPFNSDFVADFAAALRDGLGGAR